MSRVIAKSERVIPADPEEIFAVLSDYKLKRPQMLTPNFLQYKVERGGRGDGTIVSYRLHAGGRERAYRMQVDETVPGKVLTERDRNSSLVTTWQLSPDGDKRHTRVSVTTEWEGSTGVGGFFERTFAPLGLRSIYTTMLDFLAELVVPHGQKQGVLQEKSDRTSATNAGAFFLLLGSVVVVAVGLSYLQKRLREQ